MSNMSELDWYIGQASDYGFTLDVEDFRKINGEWTIEGRHPMEWMIEKAEERKLPYHRPL